MRHIGENTPRLVLENSAIAVMECALTLDQPLESHSRQVCEEQARRQVVSRTIRFIWKSRLNHA